MHCSTVYDWLPHSCNHLIIGERELLSFYHLAAFMLAHQLLKQNNALDYCASRSLAFCILPSLLVASRGRMLSEVVATPSL